MFDAASDQRSHSQELTNGIEYVPGGISGPPAEWITMPLDADVTISGTITLNLWAKETATQANAAINAVIDKIDGATGTIRDRQDRPHDRADHNRCRCQLHRDTDLDRLQEGGVPAVRVFADDAGTMGRQLPTATSTAARPPPSATGDSGSSPRT